MGAEQRLAELGWVLRPPSKTAGNYVPGVVTGSLAFMSGCVARRADGTGVFGEERGRGARAAVGMAALSRQHAVEIEMVLEIVAAG